MTIANIIEQQKFFFNSNQSKDIAFRTQQLLKLKKLLKDNEKAICQAIHSDFGKSAFEVYLTELSMIYHEIDFFVKHMKRLSRRQKVATNLINFPAKSYIIPEPLGTVLVIGAWNYPIQLSLLPAITALAAGNTVVLKPSEMTEKTAALMSQLINTHFPADYFYVYEGGVSEATELLTHRFDKIFFTGSTAVGKIIYQAAAKHLTPVTLELGGKSPTFVFADCDLATTAKRLVWGKFLNAGQTCVAPDYILVERSIEADFLDAVKKEIEKSYPNPLTLSENYLQIVNDKNLERVRQLIDSDKVFYGGQTDASKRLIAPTLMHNVNWDDAVMQEEIFGPILPVLAFDNLDNAIATVKAGEKPLACYVYGKNRENINRVLDELSFGGGAINDNMMHLTNNNLPFGGVGFSGTGNYHGKAGFACFSHQKSILDKPFWYESGLKYVPYSAVKKRVLRWLMG